MFILEISTPPTECFLVGALPLHTLHTPIDVSALLHMFWALASWCLKEKIHIPQVSKA